MFHAASQIAKGFGVPPALRRFGNKSQRRDICGREKVDQALPNRLSLIDPAFAFRVKRVVNNKLTLENFVV